MTRAQKLITAFWILIGCILLWQFYSYNEGLNQDAKDHPKQQHFFFYPPVSQAAAAKAAHPITADVHQVAFTTEKDTPPGSFTCHVTLKNLGQSKATDIQINVRPFRGVSNYDEDIGKQRVIVLTEDDPISRQGEYISFPDLAPGESATRDAIFLTNRDFKPGTNPNPEIIFKSEKPKNPPVPADSK